MGVVNANVVISNPADRSRSWEGRFVIDTSATSGRSCRRFVFRFVRMPEHYQ